MRSSRTLASLCYDRDAVALLQARDLRQKQNGGSGMLLSPVYPLLQAAANSWRAIKCLASAHAGTALSIFVFLRHCTLDPQFLQHRLTKVAQEFQLWCQKRTLRMSHGLSKSALLLARTVCGGSCECNPPPTFRRSGSERSEQLFSNLDWGFGRV